MTTRPPLVIGGFRFERRRCVPIGQPGEADWQTAIAAAEMMEDSASFWLGDLVEYGETHFGEKYTQAVEATGFAEKTIRNAAYVARAIPPSRRRDGVPFSLHAEVAPLEPEAQTHWLEVCEQESLTRAELRTRLRTAQRAAIVDPGPLPDGRFRIGMIDPPWSYDDTGVMDDGAFTRAEAHYDGMSLAEIAALPVGERLTDDAVVFLWVPAPLLFDAAIPIAAWGLAYKTNMVWDKVEHNYGHYVSARHEHLLICTRGSCTPDQLTPMIDSVQTHRRSPEHSRKPEAFRAIIDRLYPHGPRVELFARGVPPAPWVGWGNQCGVLVGG